MAKKNDFVQLTKSYCKQNKTFLGNTTVTDYLGSEHRLRPDSSAARVGAALGLPAGARRARPGGDRLPRRPIARDGESRAPAGQSVSASGAGRPIRAGEGRASGHRPRRKAEVEAAPLAQLRGGWQRRPHAAGSLTLGDRSASRRRGRGWARAPRAHSRRVDPASGGRRRWRRRWQRRRQSGRCWRRSSAGCCTTRCTRCSGSCRTSSRRPLSASLCRALVPAPRGLPSRRTSSLAVVDQVKGVLTLQGDALSQADVNLKIPRNNQLLHFAFREDKQWKLQQIQDARNHVSQAMYLLANRDESYQFRTGAEVLKHPGSHAIKPPGWRVNGADVLPCPCSWSPNICNFNKSHTGEIQASRLSSPRAGAGSHRDFVTPRCGTWGLPSQHL
uniref:protein rogdi homolog isoform X2 n=1 Tax=Nyctereutes procyonoides TaxID=34880 RepID=UPI0024448C38|nr:protein rogdi homolog isoform X2 [Nyctereutes procyonoides]